MHRLEIIQPHQERKIGNPPVVQIQLPGIAGNSIIFCCYGIHQIGMRDAAGGDQFPECLIALTSQVEVVLHIERNKLRQIGKDFNILIRKTRRGQIKSVKILQLGNPGKIADRVI